MRVGILGSGLMGGKLGTLFARAGREVVFSYARSREKLNPLAHDAGRNAQAGIPREAAQGADAILLGVHWSRIDDVLSQAGDLSGKVIVSCSLPLNASNIYGCAELLLSHPSCNPQQPEANSTYSSWVHPVPSDAQGVPVNARFHFQASGCKTCKREHAIADPETTRRTVRDGLLTPVPNALRTGLKHIMQAVLQDTRFQTR